jgi:hypothetical protein
LNNSANVTDPEKEGAEKERPEDEEAEQGQDICGTRYRKRVGTFCRKCYGKRCFATFWDTSSEALLETLLEALLARVSSN